MQLSKKNALMWVMITLYALGKEELMIISSNAFNIKSHIVVMLNLPKIC